MTRIFIGNGYFGAGNAGDDLTLSGFLGEAARRDVELTACTSHHIDACRRRFPTIRWLADDDATRDAAVRDADVWVALGDTPFQLDSGAWSLEHNERERQRCAAYGTPMYLLGVGCESREAAAEPRATALVAAAERGWTRDASSAQLLGASLDPARWDDGADLAHLAFGAAGAPPREPDVLGLLLAFERREHVDVAALARFIERRAPGTTRWLVQETRALPYLERWILDALPAPARARLDVMDAGDAPTTGQYVRAFGAPELAVTSRYHGALVAAWHGSRVTVVARSRKLLGIAEQLQLPYVERIDSPAALQAAVGAARRVPQDRLRALRDSARAMCDAFFAACTPRGLRAAPSEPLARDAMRATVGVDVPARMLANEVVALSCTVTNRGDTTFRSAPPYPVQLCYRWYDASGTAVGAGSWIHTALPRPLAPRERADVIARIAAPARTGTYTLAVTLLQENVAWFDDADPANGIRAAVTITP